MGVGSFPQRRELLPVSQPLLLSNMEEGLDHWNRNPTLCWLCGETYSDPRLLDCYHAFCGRCLMPRLLDTKLLCPLCGKLTTVQDNQLPPRDNLLTFLIDSSTSDRPPCANCERNNLAIYFCNTCGQALCAHCRESTHRAKMFSAHDVIHISKKGKEVHKKCPSHGEPYIMFSTTKHAMLCVNCFQETSDGRLHCIDVDEAYLQQCNGIDKAIMLPGETLIDIDTAYNQARQKLDTAATSIQELLNSVRDGVILFKALLDELRKNTEAEKKSVGAMVDSLQEAMKKTQDRILMDVVGQYESRQKLFRSQLSSLGALLPVIQTHLVMCTTFSASASKYDFLNVVFQLMQRLGAIAHLSHPLRPGQSSQIRSNFRTLFWRSLEPILNVSSNSAHGDKKAVSGEKTQYGDPIFSRPTSSASTRGGAPGPSSARRSTATLKMKVLENPGPFTEHCKTHDARMKEVSKKMNELKEELTELHRDVNLGRCASRKGRMKEIIRECASLEQEFNSYGEKLEELHSLFDSAWDDQIQRIYAEREIFLGQVNELASLQDENKRLIIIAQQLDPYIRSITDLMERISPKIHVPYHAESLTHDSRPKQSAIHVDSVMQKLLEKFKQEQPQPCQIHDVQRPAFKSEKSSGSSTMFSKGQSVQTKREHDEQRRQHSREFSPTSVYDIQSKSAVRSPPTSHLLPSNLRFPDSRPGARASRPQRPLQKRQHSEGDQLVIKEDSTGRRRMGSEGSELDRKCDVLAQLLKKVEPDVFRRGRKKPSRDYESDMEECRRTTSRERARRKILEKGETAERFIDRAAATFDASAVPERPKSACESTLLLAAEKLYTAAASTYPNQERMSDEQLQSALREAHSRDSSGGRARSAEREREPSIRTPKSVPIPQVPIMSGQTPHEIRALIHAEAGGTHVPRPPRRCTSFTAATVPRRDHFQTEKLYENVPIVVDSQRTANVYLPKPSSLETLRDSHYRGSQRWSASAGDSQVFRADILGSRDARGEMLEARDPHFLKKTDSFEGHEEAVRNLVAVVQENKNYRKKKSSK